MFPQSITIGNNLYTGAGNDNVHISKAGGLAGLFGLYDVNVNGQHQLMTKQQLEATNFNLGSGNDTLVVDSNVNADIHANGGTGNDTMVGGTGNDYQSGGTGNDREFGGTGNDWQVGGSGNDYQSGGTGNDWQSGGTGNDWQTGGAGHDVQVGGSGNDVQIGGPGWDLQFGGPGFDFKLP